jgi:hypothetical protein
MDHRTATAPKLSRGRPSITTPSLEKIRDDRQHKTYDDEKNSIRYKVRKGHEPNTAEQRNETLLPLSENKVRQTDRAKNYSPNQRSFVTHLKPPYRSRNFS